MSSSYLVVKLLLVSEGANKLMLSSFMPKKNSDFFDKCRDWKGEVQCESYKKTQNVKGKKVKFVVVDRTQWHTYDDTF